MITIPYWKIVSCCRHAAMMLSLFEVELVRLLPQELFIVFINMNSLVKLRNYSLYSLIWTALVKLRNCSLCSLIWTAHVKLRNYSLCSLIWTAYDKLNNYSLSSLIWTAHDKLRKYSLCSFSVQYRNKLSLPRHAAFPLITMNYVERNTYSCMYIKWLPVTVLPCNVFHSILQENSTKR